MNSCEVRNIQILVLLVGYLSSIGFAMTQMMVHYVNEKFNHLPVVNLASNMAPIVMLNAMRFVQMEINFLYELPITITSYFMMCSLTWTLILSYDTWRMTKELVYREIFAIENDWKRYFLYSLLGWIVPLFASINMVMEPVHNNYMPTMIVEILWLSFTDNITFIAFMVNLFYFLSTLYFICFHHDSIRCKSVPHDVFTYCFIVPLKFISISTLVWLIREIAFFSISKKWWTLFQIFYAYQGFIISIAFFYF